jgi:hypothetical protein
MLPSLRAFLHGIIDYAGLFPPARLRPEQALRNYARYRTEPEAWMLCRFVCPAARLGELEPFARELLKKSAPVAFSVLGRGGDDAASFHEGLAADLAAVGDFRRRYEGRATFEVLETRLPPDVTGPEHAELGSRVLRAAMERIDSASAPLPTFFEISIGIDWHRAMAQVIGSLARLNERGGRSSVGFKLRTGGVEASAFPPPEQVAVALCACRDRAVPFKATAGLHHAGRRFDTGIQATMHGFVNVFAAGILGHARRLGEDQVRQIIADEDPKHFMFNQAGMQWRDFRATPDEIALARKQLMTSFGSCSFDEPRQELKALGLLR